MIDRVKQVYLRRRDAIIDNRFNSPYWLRRYAHRQIYAQFIPFIKPGQHVLDAGCGEGILSCMAARIGASVVGFDISGPNIHVAKALSVEWDVQADFLQGDMEDLPFPDNSFDVVISSHVLEHLPNLSKGVAELRRVTRSMALIAMPTCLNPSCWVLIGGDSYWRLSKRSLIALPLGLARTFSALLRGDDGPDEGYGGNVDLPHVWRFPWVMRKILRNSGFRIEQFEAGPLVIPYLAQYFTPLRRIQPVFDRVRDRPILRDFGYGSLAVCRKVPRG